MNWLYELLRRLQHLLFRKQWDAGLEEEMRLHMDLRAADAASTGATAPDAYMSAKRRFGNATRLREESREAWGWSLLDSLFQDIRYGLRTLAATPGFTAAAILSLALGIGANTAIFSIVNALMLRALPVEDPAQLVSIGSGDGPEFTNPLWEEIRDHQKAFSGAFAHSGDRFNVSLGGESHHTHGDWVSGDYFRALGVPAFLGRVLTPADDIHGGGHAGLVAVISYSFWESHFGGDPKVLGKTVSIGRVPFQIVGVTPPWFKGLDVDQSSDIAIPIGCEPFLHTDRSALKERSWWWLRIVGRLPAGANAQRAQAQLNSIASQVYRDTLPPTWPAKFQKEYLTQSFKLHPAATGFSYIGERYKAALFTLMTVVALVLLIACANVANLLLSRAAARQREISVRLAIGASRSRVVRQLLTESLLLSVAGAFAGLLFAFVGSRYLVHFLTTTDFDLSIDLSPDWHLLAFTAAVAGLSGILFGFAPAMRSTSFGSTQMLKENPRGALAGSSRFTLGKALVTSQIALSLVLLMGAGLFLSTLRNFLTIDPGFNASNVLLVRAALPSEQVAKPVRVAMFADILKRLRAIPGVRSASVSMRTPISGFTWNDVTYPEGYKAKSERDTLVYFNSVSTGFFHTMETALVMGRDFNDRDTVTSPKVVVVSESAAQRFWGKTNPLGKTLGMERPDDPSRHDLYQVVGVVKDAKYRSLNESLLLTAYLAVTQDDDPRPQMDFALRYGGPTETLTASVRTAIAAIHKDVSLEFRTLTAQVDDSLVQPRMVALLSSFFGFLALLLAVVGLYGVISYAAARRRAEIGIRMALGAERLSVIWLVLRDVVIMLGIGIAAGIAGALASSRLVASLLFGVRPSDALTLAAVSLALGFAALTAGYLPARKASKMDPMTALRNE